MPRLIALLAVATFFLTGCGPKLSPLTQRLIDEQNWSDNELQRIQFYLSEDLVLTRELRDGKSEIRNGQVKIVNGREVEQVVFKRNTPGVFVFSPKTDRIAVSFDDTDEEFLVFGPNPRAGNRYVLLASEWNRNSGQVTYDGRKWRVSSSDAFASLMIPLRKLQQQNVNGKVARGRRVN